MKAGVVPQHGKLEVIDMVRPEPGPFDCLVRIDACATCAGTDTNIINGTFPWIEKPPFVLGHESTGIIIELGEKVENFQKGQRVTRPCGVLPGDRIDGIGSNWGGYAEYGLVKDCGAAEAAGEECGGMLQSSRFPLPPDVDYVSAALSINQREILSVVRRLDVEPDMGVAVIGSGYNGLLFALFYKHYGAGKVVMVGSPGRKEIAISRFWVDDYVDYHLTDAVARVQTALDGAPDHLIDAVGSVPSISLARDLLGSESRFGRYGIHDFKGIQPVQEEIQRDHEVLNTGTDEAGATEEWVELWRTGFFEQPGMHDGLMPLEELPEAFVRLARREGVKFIITCG